VDIPLFSPPSVIKSSLAVVLGRGQTEKKDEKITQPTDRSWKTLQGTGATHALQSGFPLLLLQSFLAPTKPRSIHQSFADNYVTLPLVTKELNCCPHPSPGRGEIGAEREEEVVGGGGGGGDKRREETHEINEEEHEKGKQNVCQN